MSSMQRGVWRALAVGLLAGVLFLGPVTRGGDTNEIVIERPRHGCNYANNTNNPAIYRVWRDMGNGDWLCIHLTNTGAPWPDYQAAYMSLGRATLCKFMIPGDGTFSFPGSAWAQSTSYNRKTYDHTYTPNRAMVWTADQDYTYVAVNAVYNASYGDIGVAYSGTGSLLQATLDCHTTASPFRDPAAFPYPLVLQRFISVASAVKSGDTLTFTTADGATVRFCTVLGIIGGYATDITTEDAVHLTQNILVAGDPALDSTVRSLRQLTEIKGDTCALGITPPTNATWWGSRAHGHADDTITGAGGSGAPTVAMTYYTAASPTGTTWDPAVGTRTTCRALRIRVVGETRMDATQVGEWHSTHVVDGLGYSCSWEIYFNGTIPGTLYLGNATNGGGYTGMMEFAGLERYAMGPHLLAPLALTADDDGMYGQNAGNRIMFYGGSLGPIVLEFIGADTEYTSGNNLIIQQRAIGTNKIYHRVDRLGTSTVAPAANSRINGGFRVNIINNEKLRPLVPRGYRR